MIDPEAVLLTAVLRSLERSAIYAAEPPWPRDVLTKWSIVLKADDVALTAVRQRELIQSATSLASRGCWSIDFERPPYHDRPRSLRCTSANAGVVEDEARARGILPAFDTWRDVCAAYRSRDWSTPTHPEWWTAYEAKLDGMLERRELAGVSSARLVEEWPLWEASLRAAAGIADGMSGYERIVSERLLGGSKKLARIKTRVAAHLASADPRWRRERVPDSADGVLLAYGIYRVAPDISAAGPITVSSGTSTMSVGEFDHLVSLPADWVAEIAEAIVTASIVVVTTIENETSAHSYVEELEDAMRWRSAASWCCIPVDSPRTHSPTC